MNTNVEFKAGLFLSPDVLREHGAAFDAWFDARYAEKRREEAANHTPSPEVSDWIGAASFLPVAQQSDVCLFI